MNKVNEVEFIFENCESLRLPSKYFKSFNLCDIRENVSRISLESIVRSKTAEIVYFEISKETKDMEYIPFGILKLKTNVFDKLSTSNDITSLILYYEDGTKELIFVKWSSENECKNSYQKNSISDSGNLYIAIFEN